jgi:hypothetical protein
VFLDIDPVIDILKALASSTTVNTGFDIEMTSTFRTFVKSVCDGCSKRDAMKELGVLLDYNSFYSF